MSIKELSQMPGFVDFMRQVEEEKATAVAGLIGQADPNLIFRLQGRVHALEWVLDLPERMDALDEMDRHE